MVYKLFDRKTSGSVIKDNLKNYINQLLENLKKGKYTYLL